MSKNRKRRRADDHQLDWLGILRPGLVADQGRAPDGTVIVRLTAVDSGGFRHFYDEMLVSPHAFARAMAILARERVSSEQVSPPTSIEQETRSAAPSGAVPRDESPRDTAAITTLEATSTSLPDRSNPMHELLGWLKNDPTPRASDKDSATES